MQKYDINKSYQKKQCLIMILLRINNINLCQKIKKQLL